MRSAPSSFLYGQHHALRLRNTTKGTYLVWCCTVLSNPSWYIVLRVFIASRPAVMIIIFDFSFFVGIIALAILKKAFTLSFYVLHTVGTGGHLPMDRLAEVRYAILIGR